MYGGKFSSLKFTSFFFFVACFFQCLEKILEKPCLVASLKFFFVSRFP